MSGPRAPVGLAARGRRMWTESLAAWSLSPAHMVLLEEACRTADRLEMLDKLIRQAVKSPPRGAQESGNDPEPSPVGALFAEARGQQTVLKGLLAELRQGTRLEDGVAAPEPSASAAGGSGVADLTRKIAARRGSPKG